MTAELVPGDFHWLVYKKKRDIKRHYTTLYSANQKQSGLKMDYDWKRSQIAS